MAVAQDLVLNSFAIGGISKSWKMRSNCFDKTTMLVALRHCQGSLNDIVAEGIAEQEMQSF